MNAYVCVLLRFRLPRVVVVVLYYFYSRFFTVYLDSLSAKTAMKRLLLRAQPHLFGTCRVRERERSAPLILCIRFGRILCPEKCGHIQSYAGEGEGSVCVLSPSPRLLDDRKWGRVRLVFYLFLCLGQTCRKRLIEAKQTVV